MNKIILFVFVSVLFFSCKKEEQSKPEEHISYTHWYKTRSGSLDTLFSVYIPNAFHPNAGGINDFFGPKGTFGLKNFKILNKNNNLIIETDDRNRPWDGKDHASAHYVQMGNYIYKLNIYDYLGEQFEYVGTVTLFR